MRGVRYEMCRWVAGLSTVLLLAVACTSGRGTPSGASPEAASAGDGNHVPLRLMYYNIENGGTRISFDNVIKVIEQSGAQVVALGEVMGNTEKVADALGWPYVDARRAIVSQLPMVPSPGDDPTYALVELQPGKVAAVANVHLTSGPYGPNLIGWKDYSLKEALANEKKVRMPEIEPVIETLAPLAEQGIPTFIPGDYNTPSHRDWTKEMVGARPQIKYAMPWPVTIALEDAGFVDAYRAIYPDPTTHPGLTWPAWRQKVQGWDPIEGKQHEDRIDMIFSAGPVDVVDAFIAGEEGADVSQSVTPWPGDHRAFVAEYEVTLTDVPPPPTLLAVTDPLVEIGTPLDVKFFAPGSEGERIIVVPEGADEAAAAGEQSTEAQSSGTASFDTAGWEAMAHEVRLLDASGEVLASAPIWVLDPGAGVTVTTGKESYKVGEPIDVSWYAAPANQFDWVGIYHRGDKPGAYLLWKYTGATVGGSAKMGKDTPGGPWPLEPGKYTVRLLLDDGYKVAAESDFVIKG